MHRTLRTLRQILPFLRRCTQNSNGVFCRTNCAYALALTAARVAAFITIHPMQLAKRFVSSKADTQKMPFLTQHAAASGCWAAPPVYGRYRHFLPEAVHLAKREHLAAERALQVPYILPARGGPLGGALVVQLVVPVARQQNGRVLERKMLQADDTLRSRPAVCRLFALGHGRDVVIWLWRLLAVRLDDDLDW